MASRIPSILSSFARYVTASTSKFTSLALNQRIKKATEMPLYYLRNPNPPTTQKKVMSLDEFKIKKMETFENYKRRMKEVSPENSEAMFDRSYDYYCHAMYRTYIRRIENPSDDPGRMI